MQRGLLSRQKASVGCTVDCGLIYVRVFSPWSPGKGLKFHSQGGPEHRNVIFHIRIG